MRMSRSMCGHIKSDKIKNKGYPGEGENDLCCRQDEGSKTEMA